MMKKIISGIAVALALVGIVGCKTIPSESTINAASYTIGKAAGYACELSKTKTEVKEGISTVLDILSETVPQTNETFVAAWMPITEVEVQKLIEAGKISEVEAPIVKGAVRVACEGVDYIFIRYPKAKAYKELVSAAVDGFINGYKSVVGTMPVMKAGQKPDFDEEAYTYLRIRVATQK